MNQSTFANTLDEMVNRLVARFDPNEIILFGLHARGPARADSEIEFLVFMLSR